MQQTYWETYEKMIVRYLYDEVFKEELLKGLQSIDKNLDLIRKALVAKKKKNAKR